MYLIQLWPQPAVQAVKVQFVVMKIDTSFNLLVLIISEIFGFTYDIYSQKSLLFFHGQQHPMTLSGFPVNSENKSSNYRSTQMCKIQ